MLRLLKIALLAISFSLPAQAAPSPEIMTAVQANRLRSAEEMARDPHTPMPSWTFGVFNPAQR